MYNILQLSAIITQSNITWYNETEIHCITVSLFVVFSNYHYHCFQFNLSHSACQRSVFWSNTFQLGPDLLLISLKQWLTIKAFLSTVSPETNHQGSFDKNKLQKKLLQAVRPDSFHSILCRLSWHVLIWHRIAYIIFNVLASGRCGSNFEDIIFKLIIQNGSLGPQSEIALR